MRRRLDKASVLLRTTIARYITYRAGIVIWMLNGITPLMTMFVWMTLAQNGTVGGRSGTDFAAYFLAVFVISQMTATPVLGEVERDIRLGELSPKLLLPIDPYWSYLSTKLAYTAIGLPVFVLPVAIVLLTTGVGWHLTPANIAAALAATGGAAIIQFNVLYLLGLIAFWTDKALALSGLWQSMHFVFSGAFAPLSLFPGFLQKAAKYMPFPYTIYFPAEIVVGSLSGTELTEGFYIQAAWVVAILLLRQLVWVRGVRRYGAVGA